MKNIRGQNTRQSVSKLFSRKKLLFLFLVLSMIATSCSYPKKSYTPQEIQDLLKKKFEPFVAEQVIIPFEVDEEIKNVATEVTRGFFSDKDRVQAILFYILDKQKVGLQYDQYKTFTAQETYNKGSGNCLSFTNLLIGMARSVGINAFYVEVTEVSDYDLADDLVVNQRHICVGIEHPRKIELIDFLPKPKEYFSYRRIDDFEAMANYYNNIGYDYLKVGKIDEAINSFEIAIRLFPSFTWAYNNLGVAFSRKKDYPRAIRSYELAILLDPSYEAPYGNIANLHLKMGEKEKAEEFLNRLDLVKTKNPYHHISRGLALKDQGKHEQAIKKMRKAISLDRRNVEARVEIAKLYIIVDQLGRARYHLKRALNLSPGNPEIKKMLASLEKKI